MILQSEFVHQKECAKQKRESISVDPSNDAVFVICKPNDMIVDDGDNDNDNMSVDNDNEEAVKAKKSGPGSHIVCSFPKCTSKWSAGCCHIDSVV